MIIIQINSIPNIGLTMKIKTMSFPQIEAELKEVKGEIQEINESIKQLVIQM